MKPVSPIVSRLALALAVSLLGCTSLAARTCGPDALGTTRILEVGSEGGLETGLKTYPRSLPLNDHELVLTFDDGPDARHTKTVLDALAAECVRATFFLIGRNAESLPLLVRRELSDGHTIAHHTFSHPAVTLRGWATDKALADIERGIQADDKAAYGTAQTKPRVPFFRFPGFADTPELLDALGKRNIAVFGTDIWASDWQAMSPEQELNLVMHRIEKAKRGVVLFHDTHQATAALMPQFLRELKMRGYKIVHIVPGTIKTRTINAPAGWKSETQQILERMGFKHQPHESLKLKPALH